MERACTIGLFTAALLVAGCSSRAGVSSSPAFEGRAEAGAVSPAPSPAARPYFESSAPAPRAGFESHASPTPEANLDWGRVDPAFVEGVRRFDAEVTGLVASRSPLDDAARPIEALADALDRLPGRHGRHPAAGVGAVMRRHADALRHHLVEQAAKRRDIKDALLVAAGALTSAAADDYAADPAVADRAAIFQHAVDEIPESAVVTTNRMFAYDALVKADRALRTFEVAIASGRVRIR
ncbi:MAG TPA: hypothetical protein VHB21_16860 [Minicystis sp.]|nr:hypothetical protein [Minicystis sp.]